MRHPIFMLLCSTLLLLAFSSQAQNVDMENLKGINIRNIGPAGMSGRVTAIDVINNKDHIIFVGTASGGVWKSESGGISWEPIFDDADIQSIGSLTINQNNPSEIWVGTGEGNPRNSLNSGKGIYKSIDGGKTWQLMGLENTRLIHRIIIHRDNPNIVYVGALGSAWGANKERGVFKTIDGGKTWKKILYVNEDTGLADMVVDPENPNKIIAAMWEFGRKPWTFNSGGKSSGLHLSFDGGETWKKLSSEDGLPKGKLGRIGLAIAPSKPNIIYALIEAKKNGLYKSTDGGHKWSLVSDENIGNRPFYYADIFVDSKNENRIFNLWSYVSKSEDGGKTFKTILNYGNNVHPDHHAFWIHPDNPNYLIDGNDGGLNISRDGGKNWRFISNLPLAQFYHIDHDMDIPYNVAGGMQDNGSWVGPSSIWKRGGIRNSDWQEVLFGDGFDVLLRKDNNRFGFAMSQEGYLNYFDRETGANRLIRPLHPDTIELRFNWNAALAENPYEECGIYFGSQFVHKSLDCGQSWEIISPDLTTNDTLKQKQDESGGLTIDATGAENYTTITAIAPSPVDKEVIWVGTDDGNLQITKDGGKNWMNVANRLPGCPAGSWIPQIEVSKKDAGVAFVIVNDYRRNNWEPYLYKTTDYGQTFRRLVDSKQVASFTHCIVQDPVEENLLFLGTDVGLYFSIDAGNKWTKWTNDFPSVTVMDLKIHPRDHDLIVGTFGRAAWILDDINPLRTLAKSNGDLFKQAFKAFDTPDGYQASFRSVDGARFIAQGEFVGSNKGSSPRMTVWVKKKDKKEKDKKPAVPATSKKKNKKTDKTKTTETTEEKKDKKPAPPKDKRVKLQFVNSEGDTIRTYHRELKEGFNRFNWNMREDGVRWPSNRPAKKDADKPSGQLALPGTYKVLMTYGDFIDSTMITIHFDPRRDIKLSDFMAKRKALDEYYQLVEKTTSSYDQLVTAKKTIKLVNSQMVNAPDSVKKEIKELGAAMQDSLAQLMALYMMPDDLKGIHRSPNNLMDKMWPTSSHINASYGAPNKTAQVAMEKFRKALNETLEKVNTFFEEDWKDYRTRSEAARHTVFKDYVPIGNE